MFVTAWLHFSYLIVDADNLVFNYTGQVRHNSIVITGWHWDMFSHVYTSVA